MIALSGFVSQHDLIIESLTVFEHMKLMVSVIIIDTNYYNAEYVINFIFL